MIVGVTTLGAADGNAAGGVKAVVKYLHGRVGPPWRPPQLACRAAEARRHHWHRRLQHRLCRRAGAAASVGASPGCAWAAMSILRSPQGAAPGQHALTDEQLLGRAGSAVRADGAGREEAAVAAHGEPDEVLTLPQSRHPAESATATCGGWPPRRRGGGTSSRSHRRRRVAPRTRVHLSATSSSSDAAPLRRPQQGGAHGHPGRLADGLGWPRRRPAPQGGYTP